jgi:hypothetical protein
MGNKVFKKNPWNGIPCKNNSLETTFLGNGIPWKKIPWK